MTSTTTITRDWQVTHIDFSHHNGRFHIQGINHCASSELDRFFSWHVTDFGSRYYTTAETKITPKATALMADLNITITESEPMSEPKITIIEIDEVDGGLVHVELSINDVEGSMTLAVRETTQELVAWGECLSYWCSSELEDFPLETLHAAVEEASGDFQAREDERS